VLSKEMRPPSLDVVRGHQTRFDQLAQFHVAQVIIQRCDEERQMVGTWRFTNRSGGL